MWFKQCHKLAMTGNGNHTTYKNGDDWGMVYEIVSTTLSILKGMITDYHSSYGESRS
jgi:hypothetical protein